MPYLHEKEAERLQNGDIHLAQIADFGMSYLENHLAHWSQRWLILFLHCIFHALSFKLISRPEFPFKCVPYFILWANYLRFIISH